MAGGMEDVLPVSSSQNGSGARLSIEDAPYIPTAPSGEVLCGSSHGKD